MNLLGRNTLNRSAIARANSRRLRRSDWLSQLIAQARVSAAGLRCASQAELRENTAILRLSLQTAQGDLPDTVLTSCAACVIEAVRRGLGIDIFDVQLQAGFIVSSGAIAEMHTGEGKTIAGVLPACLRALLGRGVHVATPNDYLAKRDHDSLSPVFGLLGLTTGLVIESTSSEERKAAYLADITYASSHTFGFDYLKDQLTVDNASELRLGDRIYAAAKCHGTTSPLLQRGLHSAIIDEVDHVLIDDAVSPMLLSGANDSCAPDAEVHREAMSWCDQLTPDVDFRVLLSGHVHLTECGFQRVYAPAAQPFVVHAALVRPWHEYVVLALRAKIFYQPEIHYIVRAGRVQIVDTATGRIARDRTWSDGLQQAIEARERLQIRAETRPLARVTRQRFYRQYAFLGGMTGTAVGCEQEFAAIYGLPVAAVPLRKPSRRVVLPEHYTCTVAEKLAAIATSTQEMVDLGRAVLIGTLSIADSHQVAKVLSSRKLSFQLLNGIQDADEAYLISQAGRRGAITVATSLAGRGTDIQLDAEVAAAGGLHVIVTQKHSLARVDRQLIGRSARCGDPGSAQVFVSAEDDIACAQAPWIARAIKRWGDSSSTRMPTLERQLLRVQRQHQKDQFAYRQQLLRMQWQDESLFARTYNSPAGCWQL